VPTGIDVTERPSITLPNTAPSATMDPGTTARGRTITVGQADSGRMITLHVGDQLAIDAPAVPGMTWRPRGGTPMLVASTADLTEPRFVLTAVKPGRTGVDLVVSGTSGLPVRPLRFIVVIDD
jgi:hypothetical protein